LKAILVLVTTPNRKTSEKLSKLLVGKRLAACVNILPSLKSRYWWKGKMETAREELLVIKTEKSKWNRLARVIRENHPYQVCEILELPAARGNPAYFKWIGESLRK